MTGGDVEVVVGGNELGSTSSRLRDGDGVHGMVRRLEGGAGGGCLEAFPGGLARARHASDLDVRLWRGARILLRD
jgi:hypothetical protein